MSARCWTRSRRCEPDAGGIRGRGSDDRRTKGQSRPDRWQYIDTEAYILTALGKTEEALVAFEPAIDVGGKDAIQFYQEAFSAHGYKIGAVDGVLGPKTRSALDECIMDIFIGSVTGLAIGR